MLITVPQAAERTGRSPETIRRWIRSGKLHAEKVGTRHMIDEEDLEFLDDDAQLPVPESWGWDRTFTGEPMPNAVTAVRRTRQGR